MGFGLPQSGVRIGCIAIRETGCGADDDAPSQTQNDDGPHWYSPMQTGYGKNSLANDKFPII